MSSSSRLVSTDATRLPNTLVTWTVTSVVVAGRRDAVDRGAREAAQAGLDVDARVVGFREAQDAFAQRRDSSAESPWRLPMPDFGSRIRIPDPRFE